MSKGPNSLIWKSSATVATTANLAGTFAAGASPASDTITSSATGSLTLDGHACLLGDRVLVKDQTTGLQNGLYVMTAAGSASSGVGPIATHGSITAGSGYISGTYTGVTLSGGTGVGAKATIVVGGTGPIRLLGAVTPGSGYTSGQYVNVALTGGTGSGAHATFLVQGGVVSSVSLVSAGTGYTAGDSLSATIGSAPTTGPIATLGSVTGGSSYTDGTYTAVNLTGGTGTGAKATIVVASGAVTTVTVTTAGTGYTVADSLSATAASIGGTGTGFHVPVATITAAAPGSGFAVVVGSVFGSVQTVTVTTAGTGYTVADVLTASVFLLGGSGSGFHVPVATVVASNWVLTRSSDALSSLEGLAVFVESGTANTQTAWAQVVAPVVLDTTAMVFKKFIG